MYLGFFGILVVVLFLLLLYNHLKKNDNRLFPYFLGSACIVPIYQITRTNGEFFLWIPLGFIIVLIYLIFNKTRNKAKVTASVLGFAVAIVLMLVSYNII